MNRNVCIETYVYILPEISAHHLQLKCMGSHCFPCHPYMESTTVLSDSPTTEGPLNFLLSTSSDPQELTQFVTLWIVLPQYQLKLKREECGNYDIIGNLMISVYIKQCFIVFIQLLIGLCLPIVLLLVYGFSVYFANNKVTTKINHNCLINLIIIMSTKNFSHIKFKIRKRIAHNI